MNKDWLELESDPGLFTLLVEDFGVEGVQVEEIYDLQKKIEGPVYGFIFLFKWIEERRSRRKLTQVEDLFVTDEKILNNMFFAQQIVPNSCATHSLLSVLLNCENIKLGETLTKLKDFSKNMSPEDKGLTISNMPQLARAHNSHARPETGLLPDQKSQGIPGRTMEAFHFASYVPLNGRLFELDGLKPYPIDHGPWSSNEDWTDKFHHVITERLGMSTGSEYDIRFNLMAVVPDRRLIYNQKLKTLKTNRQIVLETLQKLLDDKMVDVPDTSAADTDVITSTKTTLTKTSQSKPVLSPPKTRQKTKVAMATGQSPAETTTPSRPQTPPPAQSVSSPRSTTSGSLDRSSTQSPVVHAAYALDSHNYAKSPILEIPSDTVTSARPEDVDNTEEVDSDVEIIEIDDNITVSDQSQSSKIEVEGTRGANFQDSSLYANDRDAQGKVAEVTPSVDLSKLEQSNLKTDASVKICITVKDELNSAIIPSTVALTDVTRPLSIQTKFVAATSGPNSSGTDTASEMGSNLSSPVIRPSTLALHSPGQLAQAVQVKVEEGGQRSCPDVPGSKSPKPRAKHAAFTPKDLLQLLKNVEEEISSCEHHVEEEHAKRKKYKIDDCRRTHNYDEFICTFLTMLAEQGQLGGLVQQHMVVKRRQGVNVGKLHKNRNNNNRKKSRSKKKR